MERGQIRAQESAHFVRNIAAKEREEEKKSFVIFAHPPGTVFEITIADSFTVGSG